MVSLSGTCWQIPPPISMDSGIPPSYRHQVSDFLNDPDSHVMHDWIIRSKHYDILLLPDLDRLPMTGRLGIVRAFTRINWNCKPSQANRARNAQKKLILLVIGPPVAGAMWSATTGCCSFSRWLMSAWYGEGIRRVGGLWFEVIAGHPCLVDWGCVCRVQLAHCLSWRLWGSLWVTGRLRDGVFCLWDSQRVSRRLWKEVLCLKGFLRITGRVRSGALPLGRSCKAKLGRGQLVLHSSWWYLLGRFPVIGYCKVRWSARPLFVLVYMDLYVAIRKSQCPSIHQNWQNLLRSNRYTVTMSNNRFFIPFSLSLFDIDSLSWTLVYIPYRSVHSPHSIIHWLRWATFPILWYHHI